MNDSHQSQSQSQYENRNQSRNQYENRNENRNGYEIENGDRTVEGTQDGDRIAGRARGGAGGGHGGHGGRTVAELQGRLAEFAAARDWGQYHTPKNLAAALSVEAAELVEIFQWLTPEQSARVMGDATSAARVEDEVADVLAYLLQFCEVLGVDALSALEAKIERNETRFPTTGNGHSME